MIFSAPFQNRRKLYLNLLALTLFFLPFRYNISSVFGIIILLFFFIDKENTVKEKCKILFKNKLAILTLSIYLLHLLGLIYTQNFKYASLDLEIKLPLFILPFVIFSEKKLTISNLNYNLNFFTVGNAITLLICFIRAIYRFKVTNSMTVLFYNEFSTFMHPSYFSLYLGFNTIYLFNKIYPNDIKKNIVYLSICLFFIFGIIMLSSKAGIILSGLAFTYFSIVELLKKRFTIFLLLISCSIVFFTTILLYNKDIVVLSRFEQAKKELISKPNEINETNGSSNVRLEIWESSKQVFEDNIFLGVGTGDIKDELILRYKKKNFIHGVENENNCHNQYLQFFILFGILGGLLFITSLLYPIIISFRTKNSLYFYFIFLMMTNMLVESMLESKAGVEFYAILNAILLNFTTRNEQ